MNPLSLWPIVVAFALMLASAWLITRRFPAPPVAGRFATVDGLRGFLAFGVLIHHGSLWYFYVRTGKWDFPPSFHPALGGNCVILFFMITGFLFWSKLLDARSGKPFDWTRLVVSRVLRLTPLYYFALAIGAVFLALTMHFQLREPGSQLAMEIVRWASFTILHAPAVNGDGDAALVLAGVVWTLPYEWLFYFALPVAGVLVGVRTPWAWVVGAVIVTAIMIHYVNPEAVYLAGFGGGILTAYLVRSPVFCATAQSAFASALVGLGMVFPILMQLDLRHSPALLLLTIGFALVAAGNSLGGLLTLPAARFAGEITYSVYLLHGLMLYGVFEFLFGRSRAALLSPLEHWLVIFACVPVTMLVSWATFRWIEAPAMRATTTLTRWVHRSLDSKFAPRSRQA